MRLHLPILSWCMIAAQSVTLSAVAQTTPAIPLLVKSAPVEASAPDSKLRQMEVIYQQQLRARHLPVLSRYLTELQSQAAKATDPIALKAEIQRVQSLIAAGGMVDLQAISQELNPTVPPASIAAMPMPSAPRAARAVTTLTPAFASNIQPVPEGSASPEAAAIGLIEWRIETLPAGKYDLVIQYACPVAQTEIQVQAEFAGNIISKKLDASKTTKDSTSYRLLRLGQISLDKDVAGGTLRLSAGTPDSKTVLVRNFVIARAKPEK